MPSPTQNTHVETLTLNVIVLGGGIFGRLLDHEGRAHLNGIGAFTKETLESSLPSSTL